MILMLAPGSTPGMVFSGMPSGTVYTADQYGVVHITNGSVADEIALQQAGCATLTPFTQAGASILSGTTYTLQASDENGQLLFTASGAIVVTLAATLPVGFAVALYQMGAGQVSCTTATGATIVTPNASSTPNRYSSLMCLVTANADGQSAQWDVIAQPTQSGNGVVGATTLANLYTQDTTLHFAQYTIGNVYNDGTSANNGTWLKTGSGNGSGNWTQVSTLTLQSLNSQMQSELLDWVGKQNAVVDPFMGNIGLTDLYGSLLVKRARYYTSGAGVSLTTDASNPYDGRVLAVTSGSLAGPMCYPDEIYPQAGGSYTGLPLSFGAFVTGTGGTATLYLNYYNSSGALVGQVAGSNVVTSSTPQLLTVTAPSGWPATAVSAFAYIGTTTGTVRGCAFWGGAFTAANLPTMPRPFGADWAIWRTRYNSADITILDQVALFTSAVGYSADTVQLTPSSPSAETVTTTPFMGWGEAYQTSGLPGSFNCVNIIAVGRAGGLTGDNRWRKIGVAVRSGTAGNSLAANSTLHAVGYAWVNPDSSSLSNLRVLLYDPLTINNNVPTVKTVTAAEMGAEYAIIAWALNPELTGGAVLGKPLGTMPNLAVTPQSYYFTSTTYAAGNNPTSYSWQINTVNNRLGFAQELLTAPSVSYSQAVALSALTGALGPQTVDAQVLVTPMVWTTQGLQDVLQKENVTRGNPRDYLIDMIGSGYASYPAQLGDLAYTYTPTGAVADATNYVNVRRKVDRASLLTAAYTVRTTALANKAGLGHSEVILSVGDSITANGHDLRRLLEICATNAQWTATLIGSRTAGPLGLYLFTVSGITIAPSVGATYTNNGTTFTVLQVDVRPNGTTKILCSSANGDPTASGTLTKSSGVYGDATIAFSAWTGSTYSPKQEGRSGWTASDFFNSTGGRTFYQFNCTGVSVAPVVDTSIYTNNSSTWTVREVFALGGGSYTIVCERTAGTNNPNASGTLTRSSGTGDATISYGSYATVPGSPFFNPGTSQLDFHYYLTKYGFAVPHIVDVRLGTNDVFGYQDDASCAAAVTTSISCLQACKTMIAAYNTAYAAINGFSVRLVFTTPTPPALHEDAFSANYGTSQSRAMFKMNWGLQVAAMINTFQGLTGSNVWLAPGHLGIDPEDAYQFNGPSALFAADPLMTTRQSNGVHWGPLGGTYTGNAKYALYNDIAI